MRKFLLFLSGVIVATTLLQEVRSQTITIEGTGTASSYLYSPLYTFNAAPRTLRIAYIYSQPLLSPMPSGNIITKLQFSRNSAAGTLPAGNNIKLYLMNTAANDWGTGALTWDVSAATLVFDGDPSGIVGATNGYKEFALNAGFTYTGANLAVFSEYNQVSAPATTLNWDYNAPTNQPGYVANQTKYSVPASATPPATLATSTGNHPNIKIDYTPGGACTSPPTPGTATSSAIGTTCSGAAVTLGLSGNSSGLSQTYLWQSSATSGGTYANISMASDNPGLVINPVTSVFYRAAVTCGSSTVYSTPVQVSVNPLFPGGTYTINFAQPTGGTNFRTFTDAVNAIKCGINGPVVFNVSPNTSYNEQVTIPAIGGTSATNTVSFNGNAATLSFNSTTTGSRAGITLDGADFVTIDRLIITATGSSTTEYGWGVQLTNGADNNRVSNCTINVSTTNVTAYNFLGVVLGGNATTPISASNAGSNNIITGNTIIGGYYPVIAYGASAAPYPTGNVISNNIIQDAYGYSIYLYGNVNAVVSKNNITRPVRATSTTTAGVFVTTGCSGVLVEKNRVHNMFDALATSTSSIYGVYISADGTATAPNRIANNLVYDINHNGIIYGIYNTGSAYTQAYHNTISLDNTAATAGATYGMYQITSAAGMDYRNNIISITRGGSGAKYAMYFSTSGSTHTSNNNVLYVNSGGSGTQSVGYYGGTSYAALANWQTANNGIYDQQSVSLDPAFDRVTTGNFTPTTSLINNIGTPVGVTSDILDAVRSTTSPDPGAYEFSTLTVGINMGAEGLVSPAVNSSGCYTSTETVTIRIRNNSTSAVNFATNPVTVTTTVTGATTQTLTAIINSGTLASDATLSVPMPQPMNMTATGTYTISAATNTAGDVNTANDAMLPVTRTKVALTTGSVSISPSTYCAPAPFSPRLSSTGFAGTIDVQWLQSTAATTGFAPIAGARSVPYTINTAITQPLYYKLVGTCGTISDTSAAVMLSYSNPRITGSTPAGICGAGSVTLQAAGSAGTALSWFANATGGTALATGNSFTTNITANTTFYVQATEGSANTGGASPVVVTEMDLGTTTDQLEIQNVSGNAVDVTGWRVAISNSYTDITSVNTTIQTLSGVMNPGDTKTWTDLASATNYWGSNILWNPAQQGWAAILDNNNNLMDIVFVDWPAASIQNATLTIGTTVITPATKWNGDGVNVTTAPDGQSVSRLGSLDNDNSNDFAIIPFTIGSTNPGMNIPFSGFGCASARTAVLARTDACPTPVTLLNFKGEKRGSMNNLEWTTLTENNNRGFELQRSADGMQFAALSFTASKAVNGTSTNAITYTYADAKPLISNSYYRLKQIDNDGKFTYTQIVLIKGLKATSLMISSIYPNPVKGQLNMIISSPVAEKIKVDITDASGRIMYQQHQMITVGDNPLRFPVSSLAKGTYFIKAVCTNGGETAIQKFIKE